MILSIMFCQFQLDVMGGILDSKRQTKKTLTAADFYKPRLQIRNNDFNIMFCVKKLAQQYAVNQWATIEAGHLDWVRRNQKSFREDKYQGLMDAVHAGDHSLLRPRADTSIRSSQYPRSSKAPVSS